MSKVLLKKRLSSMSKAEVIGLVAELYEAKKDAKDYLDYWMNPDEDAKLEEYMKIIRYEFYPPGNREPKTSVITQFLWKYFPSLSFVKS